MAAKLSFGGGKGAHLKTENLQLKNMKLNCCLDELPSAKRFFPDDAGDLPVFAKLKLTEKQIPVFVLTWAATGELLYYQHQMLYVMTDKDPKTDILLDEDREIQLREPGNLNYINPDIKNWKEADPTDYEFREKNRQLWNDMHDTWVKQFGRGAFVAIARGELVSVSDRGSNHCPALLTFVNHIGFKGHEIAPGYHVCDPLVWPQELHDSHGIDAPVTGSR